MNLVSTFPKAKPEIFGFFYRLKYDINSNSIYFEQVREVVSA